MDTKGYYAIVAVALIVFASITAIVAVRAGVDKVFLEHGYCETVQPGSTGIFWQPCAGPRQ